MKKYLNPNYNRQAVYDRIVTLKNEGKSYEEIATLFNEEGLRTAGNLEFRGPLIYSIYQNQGGGRASKVTSRREMISIEAAPIEAPESKSASSGKVVAIMGGIEEVSELLKGWMK